MELHEFIDVTGRKRLGIKKSCPVCNKDYITRKDQVAQTCSTTCKYASRKKRERRNCSWCKKEFERKISHKTKSGLQFCSQACKNNAQKIGGLVEVMPSHYGTGSHSHTYRNIYRELHNITQLKCTRCGYCEFECGVDIHHIDENRDNNSKENLISLCSPCHRALHFGCWKLEEITQRNILRPL